MTKEQQFNLVKFGDSINVKVVPVMVLGKLGVNYRDFQVFDADRAQRDLLNFSCEISTASK